MDALSFSSRLCTDRKIHKKQDEMLYVMVVLWKEGKKKELGE